MKLGSWDVGEGGDVLTELYFNDLLRLTGNTKLGHQEDCCLFVCNFLGPIGDFSSFSSANVACFFVVLIVLFLSLILPRYLSEASRDTTDLDLLNDEESIKVITGGSASCRPNSASTTLALALALSLLYWVVFCNRAPSPVCTFFAI